MVNVQEQTGIKVVVFDFGGVLAEEGFRNGLAAIAKKHRLNESDFFSFAHGLMYSSGYVIGKLGEHAYWQTVRESTGIRDTDEGLRNEILSRFVLRPWMLDIVKRLRAKTNGIVILSDQTNWLDELDARDNFFQYFDVVLNSYHLGKSKEDPSLFSEIAARLNYPPQQLLFVDDNDGHCRRAREKGLRVIHYTDQEYFLKKIEYVLIQ
ncbi:MAG TPA: HAD family phosphatase [Syntrophorhabdaceae bacterium]|nr:HAD family phosphatase [Syntrophorhabdaceae bacterium]